MSLSSQFLCEIDPIEIMRLAGFQTVKWQAEMARTPSARKVILCSRQVGKSLTAAAMAIQTMLRWKGHPVIIVTPTERQGKEVMIHAKRLLLTLPMQPNVHKFNETTLQFDSDLGSRLLVLPGKSMNIRGFGNSKLIIMDEAAYIPSDLYSTVEPMLASDGVLIQQSTPFGKIGAFWETWNNAGPDWQRIKVTAYECPYRYTLEELERKRADPLIGERAFRQEYLCEFVDTVDSVFDSTLIEAALSSEVNIPQYLRM